MAEPRKKSDADIALAETFTVNLGSGEDRKEYKIQTFKMIKTLVVLKHLSRLLEEDALKEIIGGPGVDIRKVILSNLPGLIDAAQGTLFELFAYILTPNRDLIRLRNEEDGKLEEHIEHFSEELMEVVEANDAFAILQAGVDAMGVDVLVKNLQSLTSQIQTPKTTTTTPLTVVTQNEA